MKKIYDIDEWKLDNNFPNAKRLVEVNIHLKFIETESILNNSPIERNKKVSQDLNEKFKKLLKTKLFDTYELIGTTKEPSGVKTKINFTSLTKLNKLNYISNVFINKIEHAKRIIPKQTSSYFCVKMTTAIEIEGLSKGNQTIEERFVLIKAKSFDDAYKKIEKTKESYSKPYLNSRGELVRWKIESFDDCYDININNIDEFNKSEGVEIYSKLKSRRLTKERIWDGKAK